MLRNYIYKLEFFEIQNMFLCIIKYDGCSVKKGYNFFTGILYSTQIYFYTPLLAKCAMNTW